MIEKTGFCSLCRSRCGTINVFEKGRLVEVKPNLGHPTGEAICPKGRAAPEIVHSARRLTCPLRRTNPKRSPDPGWVEISWDEALSEIAGRLTQYRKETGAESVAFAITSQSSSSISDSTDWIQRFVRLYGSPNNCFAVEMCNWHKDYAHAFTFGVGLAAPDYANSDLMVLWGHDPANSWLAQANAIGAARASGARLLVIDPHKSGSANNADVWCRIRPGTDGALALGLAKILIEREAYDVDFVRSHTNAPYLVREDTGLFLRGSDLGWENEKSYVAWSTAASGPVGVDTNDSPVTLTGTVELRGKSGDIIPCRTAFDFFHEACGSYSATLVSKICNIPAAQVEEIAELYASAKSVSYYLWTGLGQHTNATQTDRAVAILHALSGSFDAPGGNVLFAKHAARRINDIGLMDKVQRNKALGLEKRPLGPPNNGWVTSHDLCDAILDKRPYGVRALIGFGSNIIVSHPNPERSRAALEALDFQVHCDLFMNPTAELADIVLPVNSAWERESLRVGFEISQSAEELVQLRQKMLPSLGQSRSDMEIVFDLACRIGLGDQFFDGSIEAGFNHILEPVGITVAELRSKPEGIRKPLKQQYRKYMQAGFATESGKVEIYSELFQRNGYSPVPHYLPPRESLTTQHPYTLTTGNRGNFCHSQHRGIASLRRRSPDPEVRIHPTLAAQKGLKSGDWATINTRIGLTKMRVRTDETVNPQVVVADYGFWQACPDLGLPGSKPGDPNGNNYNNVISNDECDPISGSVALRSFACNIAPASRGYWEGFRELVVTARDVEANGVVSLTLAATDTEPLAPYLPGQYVTLKIGEYIRSYSLTGPAQPRPIEYRIAVRDIGPASKAITEQVKVGDHMDVRAPIGVFALPLRNEFPIVLVAAGIGITPFMSLLRTMTGDVTEPHVTLYYCSRDIASQTFGPELDELAKKLPNLTVVKHLTAPRAGDRYDRLGRVTAGSIDPQLIAARARFYLCGPADMMRSMTGGLVAKGVMKFEIFQELFQSAATTVPLDTGPFEIRFARSNRTVTWSAQAGTILSCAEAAGLPLPNGCRVGHCESCSAQVVSGKVFHLVDVAIDEDAACLTCQAVPSTNLVLDI